MSIPLQPGVVTIAHADSSRDKQIRMAAEAIWGIEGDKLPREKFDELMGVLVGYHTRQYGPYEVRGFGDVFLITMDQEVTEASYKKRPCSLGRCMVTDAAFKCSKCKVARYCSKEHQGLDWSRHKVECISTKK